MSWGVNIMLDVGGTDLQLTCVVVFSKAADVMVFKEDVLAIFFLPGCYAMCS